MNAVLQSPSPRFHPDEWKARGHQADMIVAVPDTSRPAAQAMAERLDVAYREGFIKNRYSARTFIMPDQRSREAEMRLKLNPIEEIFRGQRVILVDDSIVRGTTMRRIVQMVRRLDTAGLETAALLGDYQGGPWDLRAEVWIILARRG